MLNQMIDQRICSLQIDSLTGLGVVKVECGSQFSVALTKSGAVYTWYAQSGTEKIGALVSLSNIFSIT